MNLHSLKKIFKAFIKGISDRGVWQMIAIFILSGAFAGMAREIGSVDATVNFALSVIPGNMILVGVFLTACIISFSVGTSCGTIVAVVPIATALATDLGISIPMMTGIVVGGAFFGDNLSFISDTTLAATSALGVKMKDKFKVNLKTVAPAFIICLFIYLFIGLTQTTDIPEAQAYDLWLLLPYVMVLILALFGINVLLILIASIICCIIEGVIYGHGYGLWEASLGGMLGMKDVIIVALIAGGIIEVVKRLGWMGKFTNAITSKVNSRKGAEASIATLVGVTNIFTANNTVAIIATGGIAKEIAQSYGLDNREVAGILDIFSCLVQSLIPYGAQLLMASSLAAISATSIIPFLFYPLIMGICAVLRIALWKN